MNVSKDDICRARFRVFRIPGKVGVLRGRGCLWRAAMAPYADHTTPVAVVSVVSLSGRGIPKLPCLSDSNGIALRRARGHGQLCGGLHETRALITSRRWRTSPKICAESSCSSLQSELSLHWAAKGPAPCAGGLEVDATDATEFLPRICRPRAGAERPAALQSLDSLNSSRACSEEAAQQAPGWAPGTAFGAQAKAKKAKAMRAKPSRCQPREHQTSHSHSQNSSHSRHWAADTGTSTTASPKP